MTDDLTRSQEEAVRRLLAEARETGPMPADVAARLDAVLAGLARTPDAAAEPATDQPGTVVPLRRRRLPRLVLAAAAVTALGFGTVQVLDRGGDDATTSDAGDAAESADGAAQLDRPSPADEGPVIASEGAGADAGPSAEQRRGYAAAPVTLAGLDRALRARGLAPVGRLVSVEAPGRSAAQQRVQELDSFSGTTGSGPGAHCGPLYDVVGGSAYTSASSPDTLVVAHQTVNGIRLVEVYDCAGDAPRHSAGVVTLAAEE